MEGYPWEVRNDAQERLTVVSIPCRNEKSCSGSSIIGPCNIENSDRAVNVFETVSVPPDKTV